MQIKLKEARAIAAKLRVDLRNTTHKIGWVEYKGVKILPVKISFGQGDIPGKVSDKIRQQYRVNEEQFRDLVACPLDYDGYIQILTKKGLI